MQGVAVVRSAGRAVTRSRISGASLLCATRVPIRSARSFTSSSVVNNGGNAGSSSPASSSASSSASDPPKKPRRVNPYRLPSLTTFLASFAPLHAAGWRLDVIPDMSSGLGATSHNASTDMLSGVDLQNKRMTRAYAFPANREGWRALTSLLARVGEAVEVEDHHPSLTVAPFSDLPPPMREIVTVTSDEVGYVLHISTHTHTPLPPLGAEGAAVEGTPRPGVTYKDLKLAERIEALVDESGM